MKFIVAEIFLFLLVSPISGQTTDIPVGSCSPGRASTELNIGNVRARIVNDGGLFWNGSPSIYEVPIGSGINAIFADELNIVGKVNGELRVATSIWGGLAEYWPGPIPVPLSPPTNCSEFDIIWSVDRAQDLRSDFDVSPSQSLLSWPVDIGAPFVDVNNDTNYDPTIGDYPKIFGDQMHWWIMNDIGNTHKYAATPPLGIEVIVSAFAFDRSSEFRDVTFFRYEITNRQLSIINEMYVGKFIDADVGNSFDDFSATDSSLSMIYTYNDSNEDSEYGEAPPAIGMSIVEASHSRGGLPSDLALGTGKFMTHSASPFGFDPGSARDPIISIAHHNMMTGKLSTGEPMTEGGYGGNDTGLPTPYVFPGDPVSGTFWSERNLGNGEAALTGDRKMLGSYGPFDLEPNEKATFTFAYLWARGSDYLDSITSLRQLASRVHEEIESILTPRSPIPTGVDTPFSNSSLRIDSVFPNPARESVNVVYSIPTSGYTEILVFDLLSRKVATEFLGSQSQGSHQVKLEISMLKPGIYNIILVHPAGTQSASMLVL